VFSPGLGLWHLRKLEPQMNERVKSRFGNFSRNGLAQLLVYMVGLLVEDTMRKFSLSLIAVASLCLLGSGETVAANKGRVISGSPPHISTTGQSHRSPVARTKGANSPRFCPPGQRRKAGKGSAFNC